MCIYILTNLTLKCETMRSSVYEPVPAIYIVILILFCVSPVPVASESKTPDLLSYEDYLRWIHSAPDSFNRAKLTATPNIFQSAISMYQGISKSRRCIFVPSCSRYAYLCFEGMNMHSAMIRTFSRLYRCNISAFNSYPSFGNYLYDSPSESQYNPSPELKLIDNDHTLSYSDDYGTWLLVNEEWDAAYQHYLEKVHAADSRYARLRLSVAALNLNKLSSVRRWLADDVSPIARCILAISHYRAGAYEEAGSLSSEILMSYAPLQWKRRSAVIYLASYLHAGEEPDSTLAATAAHELFNPRDTQLMMNEFEGIYSNHARWPYAFASIVPGLGQTVSGYIYDGLNAFVICTLLGLGTYSSFDDGNVAGGTLFAGIFLYAYLANMQSALASRDRKTTDRAILVRDRLYKRCDPTAKISLFDEDEL